jgi:hypothetical protein
MLTKHIDLGLRKVMHQIQYAHWKRKGGCDKVALQAPGAGECLQHDKSVSVRLRVDRMESPWMAPTGDTIRIRKIRGCPRIVGFMPTSDELDYSFNNNGLIKL